MVLLSTGCMSMRSVGYRIDGHTGEPEQEPFPHFIYDAAAWDIKTITYPLWMPSLYSRGLYKLDAQEGVIWVMIPFAIVDLPFAIVVDTLLFPYDAYVVTVRDIRNRKSNAQAEQTVENTSATPSH